MGLETIEAPGGGSVVFNPGWSFRLMTVITLTTGTAFIMWLGEQITERGIGNGISLIIFAGIVAAMPSAVVTTFEFVRQRELSILVAIFIILLMIAVVAAIVFMERAQRRIPVQYAKRVVGRRMYSGQSSHLPLKVNTSGVIPPIFASSLLLFPGTVTGFIDHPWAAAVQQYLAPGTWVYTLTYVGLIIFFCYFYTAVTFNPTDVADNMKKFGGYIPGIRPGPRTAEYIDRILTRITLTGALYVAGVCVLPERTHPPVPDSVLLRRHRPPDRCRCGARHDLGDGDAHDHAQLRRIHEARPYPGKAIGGCGAGAAHGSAGRREGDAGEAVGGANGCSPRLDG